MHSLCQLYCNRIHFQRSRNVYALTHYLKNMIQSDEESPVEDFIEEPPICIPHVCHIPGCDKWYDSNRALNRHIHLNHRKRYLPTPSVREQNIYCKRFKRICLNYNYITMSRAFATHPDFLVYATDKAKSAIRRSKYRRQVFMPIFIEKNERFLHMKKLLKYLSKDRKT